MAQETLDPKTLPRGMAERRKIATELKEKATEAFQRGELVTATLFASDLLMLYPNERGYLDVFDEVVLSVPDPLSLLPVESGAIHVATAAGRARVLMMQRRLPEALELLGEAVRVAPDLPYLHWVARWLQPAIIPSLSWDLLFESVVKTALMVAVGVPVPPPEDDPRIANLRAAATFFGALRQAYASESILWYGETLIRRRLGDVGETLAVAEEAARLFPADWRIRTGLLNAYRDAERPDDALAQARTALEINASDLSPLHDAAWAFVDTVRNEEAAGLFSELLERDPEYPGAAACKHYAGWLAYRSPEDEQALLRLREQMPWDEQAVRFADEVEPSRPYVNVLPAPSDATATAARHLASELAHVIKCCGIGGSVEIGLTSEHLDSPSVGVAFELAMQRLGAKGTLRIDVEEVQAPDPRTDKAQLSTRVWSYEGTTPVRAYPAGDARAQEAIAGIARTLFRREEWDAAAKGVADSFGYEGYHALMSVLTYPPLPPEDEGFDAFNWMWRCQVATAVVLSHLGPWETGSARAALYSMVYGPSDWVTGAALVAFGWRVNDDPSIRGEVEAIFQWLRTQIPEKGYTAWEIVLAEVWKALSGHPPQLEQELDEWIERYSASLPGKNVVKPPERKYGGLTLEEYVRFCVERDKILAAPGSATDGPEIAELCQRFGVPLQRSMSAGVRAFVPEWQEALNATPELHERFLEMKRSIELEALGVSKEEKAALDQITSGNMDMHLRMAQAQQAQREVSGDDEPDPLVFPGQSVAKLSDYVGILKGMQRGDMMGALARYGLDMMSYSTIASAWGAKLAADPALTEKFTRMMNG